MTEYGDFSYDAGTRTLRGILLPFGEKSRVSVSGTEPIMFSAASIDLPADPSVVTLNRNHDRHDPVGRATVLEKRTEGVYAEFRLANTPEADTWLSEQRDKLRKLSAEVAGIVRDGLFAVRSKLTGAALVEDGAFASAALFALGPIETTEHHEDTYTDPDGVTWQRVEDTQRVTKGDTTTTTSVVVESITTDNPDPDPDPDADPAEDNDDNDESEDALMSNIVPGGTAKTAPALSANGLFAAIAHGNTDALAQYAEAQPALFAISTLQQSGPSTVTIGADTQIPAYIGELWTRRRYARKYVPLLSRGELTSYQVIGWKWDTANSKAPVVGDYTGNTAEVPSNDLDTVQVTATAARIAGGHKIDRKYFDFGDNGVVASYFAQMVEDVARKTDAKALAAIKNAATPKTVSSILVQSVPAVGLQGIVDAALGVIATENTPSYALVAPELWRDIILSPKDDVLAYLNAGFGLEAGSAEGFTILPADVGTGKVIVGAREALSFYELGGEAPIRVEGIDPHHGAIDPAVFAYWATITHNAAAIVSVDTATYDDGEGAE